MIRNPCNSQSLAAGSTSYSNPSISIRSSRSAFRGELWLTLLSSVPDCSLVVAAALGTILRERRLIRKKRCTFPMKTAAIQGQSEPAWSRVLNRTTTLPTGKHATSKKRSLFSQTNWCGRQMMPETARVKLPSRPLVRPEAPQQFSETEAGLPKRSVEIHRIP